MIRLPLGAENGHAVKPLQGAKELASVQRDQEHGALSESALILLLDVHSVTVDEQVVDRCSYINEPTCEHHVTGVKVCHVGEDHAKRWSKILNVVVQKMRVCVRVLSDDLWVDLLDVLVLSDLKADGGFGGSIGHPDLLLNIFELKLLDY